MEEESEDAEEECCRAVLNWQSCRMYVYPPSAHSRRPPCAPSRPGMAIMTKEDEKWRRSLSGGNTYILDCAFGGMVVKEYPDDASLRKDETHACAERAHIIVTEGSASSLPRCIHRVTPLGRFSCEDVYGRLQLPRVYRVVSLPPRRHVSSHTAPTNRTGATTDATVMVLLGSSTPLPRRWRARGCVEEPPAGLVCAEVVTSRFVQAIAEEGASHLDAPQAQIEEGQPQAQTQSQETAQEAKEEQAQRLVFHRDALHIQSCAALLAGSASHPTPTLLPSHDRANNKPPCSNSSISRSSSSSNSHVPHDVPVMLWMQKWSASCKAANSPPSHSAVCTRALPVQCLWPPVLLSTSCASHRRGECGTSDMPLRSQHTSHEVVSPSPAAPSRPSASSPSTPNRAAEGVEADVPPSPCHAATKESSSSAAVVHRIPSDQSAVPCDTQTVTEGLAVGVEKELTMRLSARPTLPQGRLCYWNHHTATALGKHAIHHVDEGNATTAMPVQAHETTSPCAPQPSTEERTNACGNGDESVVACADTPQPHTRPRSGADANTDARAAAAAAVIPLMRTRMAAPVSAETTGARAPALRVTPSCLDWGPVVCGRCYALSLRLTNVGDVPCRQSPRVSAALRPCVRVVGSPALIAPGVTRVWTVYLRVVDDDACPAAKAKTAGEADAVRSSGAVHGGNESDTACCLRVRYEGGVCDIPLRWRVVTASEAERLCVGRADEPDAAGRVRARVRCVGLCETPFVPKSQKLPRRLRRRMRERVVYEEDSVSHSDDSNEESEEEVFMSEDDADDEEAVE